MIDPASSDGNACNDVADLDAMRRLRDGEDRALSEIMDRWERPLVSYLYRLLGNREDATDLAQESFVRVYRHRHRYRTSGKFSSFIFTIATNLAKNQLRWRSRHPETSLDPEAIKAFGSESSGDDPIDHLERTEEAAHIRDAVQSLPEKLRLPVVLFHFEERSHAEIADILKCSEKAVETRLYRGRKQLEARLSSFSEKN